MFDTDEFTEVEGRYYVNPQTALDESNDFITNLRNTQEANTQQIKTDTYNLGTAVPSNLGGLTGAESYFASRYQTPQTASAVANLRATAQAAALNQVLENEQAVWKKRYQDAYRNYQKSAYDKTNSPDNDTIDGGVDEESTGLYGSGKLSLDANDLASGGHFVQSMDPNSTDIIWVDPSGNNITYYQQADGSYSTTKPGSNNNSNWWTTGRGVNLTGIITDYRSSPKKQSKTSTSGFSGR